MKVKAKKYKVDKMKKYIEVSELRMVSKDLRIRLSKELAKKYDAGVYESAIKNLKKDIKQIIGLGLKYPGRAKPVFYVYLVPDDNFIELLSFPYKTWKSGGRPVSSYDLDGFNQAYGLSQNIFINGARNIMREVNDIHELAHLVHSQFFYNIDSYICEGFAEVLPLYAMDYEDKFDEHCDLLKKLKVEQIYSAKELLAMEKEDYFYNGKTIISNKSCSFRLPYISSYLFVRACIEKIGIKFNFSKQESVQKFLEIVKDSHCINEWLVYTFADILDVSRDELLCGKKLQFEVIVGL